MNADALFTILKQEPFEPFQLILSSGDRYPVPHPEMVLPLKNRVLVAYEPDKKGDLPDRYATVSYLHIAGTEPFSPRRRRSAGR